MVKQNQFPHFKYNVFVPTNESSANASGFQMHRQKYQPIGKCAKKENVSSKAIQHST